MKRSSNFGAQAVGSLLVNEAFAAAGDQVITPTYVPHLCNAVLDLAIVGACGVWHLTNGGGITWADSRDGWPELRL